MDETSNSNNRQEDGNVPPIQQRASSSRRKSYSCLLLPHGSYSLLVATLSTLAWLASLFQDGCDFAQVQGPIVERLVTRSRSSSSTDAAAEDETSSSNIENIPPWLEFGIGAYRSPSQTSSKTWQTTFDEPCQLYPLEYFDTAWATSRTFLFLALVMGGGGTLFLWCSTCFVFGRATWRWTGYELLLASLFQGFGFLWFHTQLCDWNTCTLFWGSKADIAGAVGWFLCGILMVCRYPEPRDWNTEEVEQHQALSRHPGQGDTEMSPAEDSTEPQEDDTEFKRQEHAELT